MTNQTYPVTNMIHRFLYANILFSLGVIIRNWLHVSLHKLFRY